MSHECIRDQYPFKGQMRTCTGRPTALVTIKTETNRPYSRCQSLKPSLVFLNRAAYGRRWHNDIRHNVHGLRRFCHISECGAIYRYSWSKSHQPRDIRRCLAILSTVRHLTAIVDLNVPTLRFFTFPNGGKSYSEAERQGSGN